MRRSFLSVFLVVAAYAMSCTALAQVQIGFDAPSVSLYAGERRLIPVQVTGVPNQGLAAFQWIVRYDPAVVRVYNPNEAARGTIPPFAPLGGNAVCASLRGGTCNDPAWMIIASARQAIAGPDVVDNVAGRVQVVYGTAGSQQPPIGNGVLALLEIEAAAAGTTSLTLEAITLADRSQPPNRISVSNSSQIAISVSEAGTNRAPVIAEVGPVSVPEATSSTVGINVSDPDGDSVMLNANGLPSFASFVDDGGGVGRLILSPSHGHSGSYSARIIARDSGSPSRSDSRLISITVPKVNRTPSIAAISDRTSSEGAPVSFTVIASDLDNDQLTFSSPQLPPGIGINSATGTISGTPTFEASGNYAVVISVSDGAASASASFSWTISNSNRAPRVNQPSEQTTEEGQPHSLTLTATDEDGDDLTYSAIGLPPGFSIAQTTGLISGTAPYTAAGSYSVTVQVSDGNSFATRSFGWAVMNVNRAPQLVSPGNQTSDEGAIISLQLSAPDPDGQTVTFQGTGLPPDLALSSAGLISGTINYDAQSTYTFSVIATDGSLSDSATLSWVVNDRSQPPVIEPMYLFNFENDLVSRLVSASDPEDDTITYGASNLPPGITINPSTGLLSGRLTYTSAGTHTITLTASDGTNTVNRIQTWQIENTNRLPSLSPLNDRTSEVGESVSFSVMATDPDGDALEYIAEELPVGISISPNTGVVSGTVGGDAPQTYSVFLRVSDGDDTAYAEFQWKVFPPGGTPEMLDLRVNNSADDAEENVVTGAINLTNDDLELGYDGSVAQYVGIRFRNVTIPRNAIITSAYLQFQVDEVNDNETFVMFNGQLHENPSVFTTGARNISSRPVTSSGVEWAPWEWFIVGEQGVDQRTDDLAAIVQEIVALPNWRSSNAMVFIASGSGERTAEAYNGLPAGAPLLHVEYIAAANQSPALSAPSSLSHSENEAVSVVMNAVDPEGVPVSCSASGLPPGLSMNSTNCTITGVMQWGAVGSYTTLITASDGTDTTTVTVPWTVTARTNQAPVVLSPGEQASMEGSVISKFAMATDADGDAVTWIASGLPPGLSINAGTGAITGTISANSAATYSAVVTASDGQLSGTASITWRVLSASGSARVVEARVIASSDDAEQRVSNGAVTLNSDDLELVSDASNAQRIGIRFRNLNIPRNATITKAWVQFQVDETSSAATSVTIAGQLADNAAAFTTSTNNISSRTLTSQTSTWTIPAWSRVGASGADQRTPNLTSIIQPIVNRSGWSPNNGLVLVITGSGSRIAEAWDGLASGAPQLHVEYTQ